MDNLLTKESVDRNYKYSEAETSIQERLDKLCKKQKSRFAIMGIISVLLVLCGALGLIISDDSLAMAPLMITSFAFLLFGVILTISIPLALTNEIQDFENELHLAQKELIASYGLEITEFELSLLNFPNLGSPKTEGLRGVADAVNKETNALERITLRIDASGAFVLSDKNGVVLR